MLLNGSAVEQSAAKGEAPGRAETMAAGGAEPLPSWVDGAARKAMVDFVVRVTDPASADFVPEPERIAVFDNDGTLWSERPV